MAPSSGSACGPRSRRLVELAGRVWATLSHPPDDAADGKGVGRVRSAALCAVVAGARFDCEFPAALAELVDTLAEDARVDHPQGVGEVWKCLGPAVLGLRAPAL